MADTLTKTDLAACQDLAPQGYRTIGDAFRMNLKRHGIIKANAYLGSLLEALCEARVTAFLFIDNAPVTVPPGYWQFQKRTFSEPPMNIEKSGAWAAMRGAKVIPCTREGDKFERGYLRENDIAALLAGKAARGRGAPKKVAWDEFDRRAREMKNKGEELVTGMGAKLARSIFRAMEGDGLVPPTDAKKAAERLKKIWDAY